MTMASGGARARSGPAPDPNAFRRERDNGEWATLPAAGREGATPDWPLNGQTMREAELWEQLWVKPQACMWERYGQEFEVALYVRRFAEAEEIEAKVTLSTLVRQMADSLGLTTPGMRANRWRILREDGPAEQPASGGGSGGAAATGRKSSKSRLTVVKSSSDGE
jgi:hypothetical protein